MKHKSTVRNKSNGRQLF